MGEDDVSVEGRGIDSWGDGIVEIEVFLSGLFGEPLTESYRCERSGCEDEGFASGEDFFSHLGGEEFALDCDVGVLLESVGYGFGEMVTIDAEGGSSGDGVGFGGWDEEGAKGAHFGLELSGGGSGVLGFEAVAADKFGEVGGFVGRG